jgi:hypothetical protein
MTDRICGGESNGRFVGLTYLGTQYARCCTREMNCADDARGTGAVTPVKLEIVSLLLSAAVATITFEAGNIRKSASLTVPRSRPVLRPARLGRILAARASAADISPSCRIYASKST